MYALTIASYLVRKRVCGLYSAKHSPTEPDIPSGGGCILRKAWLPATSSICRIVMANDDQVGPVSTNNHVSQRLAKQNRFLGQSPAVQTITQGPTLDYLP